MLGPFVVTGTYPGDGSGGTGPVLSPVPELRLTPPTPGGWGGIALGATAQGGATWFGGIFGGSAGFYVDFSGRSFGFYYGGSHSWGLGGALSAGPQASYFSSLNAFKGAGVGGEVMLGPGVSLTTPLTDAGSGVIVSGDVPPGAGGGLFVGEITTYTSIGPIWHW